VTGVATIDGSYGEGGGQILRTAVSLSALLGRPVEIRDIRAGREKPGLRAQHLMAVRAVALTTSAKTRGAELGSRSLYFEPGALRAGNYTLDVGTAGSTSLVLQSMIPPLLLAEGHSHVTVKGGTHVPWSPSFHYLRDVFVPALRDMGATVSLEIERWGWYPKGGGKVTASISPTRVLRPLDRMERGSLRGISVLSAVSNLPSSIADRQKDRVVKRLEAHGYRPGDTKTIQGPSPGTGTMVFIGAEFEKGTAGFSALGARGKSAETVGDEAATSFLAFMASRAGLDVHLADQMVLYMALAQGRSSFVTADITKHLMTNMWVIEQFLPVRFDLDRQTGLVSVEGHPLVSSHECL
jgi:RNA 3'-terminal phosphate cyclase (ATP)